jgi:putative sulfotransferase
MSQIPATMSAVASAPDIDRAVILTPGRCGSTLLSDLIAQEPGTASVSEYLGLVSTDMLDDVISGAQFWSMLAACCRQHRALVRMNLLPPEFRYPAWGRRAGNLAELPLLLGYTLPSVCPDPDQLFDQLAARVPQFPTQPGSAHHAMFLDLLASLTGKEGWVERTGGSCGFAGAVLRVLPAEAKVVYLTRHAADTARSMSRHPAFQFAALRLAFVAAASTRTTSAPRTRRSPRASRPICAPRSRTRSPPRCSGRTRAVPGGSKEPARPCRNGPSGPWPAGTRSSCTG